MAMEATHWAWQWNINSDDDLPHPKIGSQVSIAFRTSGYLWGNSHRICVNDSKKLNFHNYLSIKSLLQTRLKKEQNYLIFDLRLMIKNLFESNLLK